MPANAPQLPTLPLFPLSNVVHFPHTDLVLHVFEPRYRALVRDLEAQEAAGEAPLVGMVVSRSGELDAQGRAAIFPAGTAGRLTAVERLADGRSNIVLRGEFRFAVEREGAEQPYRTATVRPCHEPGFDEQEPGIVTVREQLLALAAALATEMGSRFPLALDDLHRLIERGGFAGLVNGLASEIDLPVRRKLMLLDQPLPERALEMLAVLRSRRHVLDVLRPFRHLAAGAEHN